uniref:CASPASE_P20 domain-containing protein n=1 Tax=Panagrellus redivivus TaxID=6233 RepID=A0A7E4UR39_PANRE
MAQTLGISHGDSDDCMPQMMMKTTVKKPDDDNAFQICVFCLYGAETLAGLTGSGSNIEAHPMGDRCSNAQPIERMQLECAKRVEPSAAKGRDNDPMKLTNASYRNIRNVVKAFN